MVREEWLNEGDAVYSERVVERALAYIRYVGEHYPEIDTEAKNHINKLK